MASKQTVSPKTVAVQPNLNSKLQQYKKNNLTILKLQKQVKQQAAIVKVRIERQKNKLTKNNAIQVKALLQKISSNNANLVALEKRLVQYNNSLKIAKARNKKADHLTALSKILATQKEKITVLNNTLACINKLNKFAK
ncbi:hypothetical protein RDV78_07760 [Bacillota bacterium LX-D]|nr:hypothetical protein [Bacillota bacterium LX-D]